MAILKAPPSRSFATAPQGVYTARVMAVKVEDHTVKPDPFGNVGHYSLQFTWHLDNTMDEDSNPIEVLHTLKFQTGDFIAKQGARPGHMPWLTEYTRAFGMPDIQAGQDVDTDHFLGLRATLGILMEIGSDGRGRNKVNSIQPAQPKMRSANPTRPAGKAPPPAELGNTGDWEQDDTPF